MTHSIAANGLAVFGTFKGLIAEGAGVLSDISKAPDIIEFRDNRMGDDALPYENEKVIFRKSVTYHDTDSIQIIGALRRSKDREGRIGYVGSCFALSYDDLDSCETVIEECDRYNEVIKSHGISAFKDIVETAKDELEHKRPTLAEYNVTLRTEESEIVRLVAEELSGEHGAFVGACILRQVLCLERHRDNTIIIYSYERENATIVDLEFLDLIRSKREKEVEETKRRYVEHYQHILEQEWQQDKDIHPKIRAQLVAREQNRSTNYAEKREIAERGVSSSRSMIEPKTDSNTDDGRRTKAFSAREDRFGEKGDLTRVRKAQRQWFERDREVADDSIPLWLWVLLVLAVALFIGVVGILVFRSMNLI